MSDSREKKTQRNFNIISVQYVLIKQYSMCIWYHFRDMLSSIVSMVRECSDEVRCLYTFIQILINEKQKMGEVDHQDRFPHF